MSFGIANNVRSEVRECTPDLLNAALDSPKVAKVCAEIEDALEKCCRGEITKEEYEALKARLKKQLPIITFHATFKNGKRKNEDAVPSGFSIYDLDHIENPRAKWASIEPRAKELGILLSHISPSLKGLRLVFERPPLAGSPAGGESHTSAIMSLADSQAWMAQQLGDDTYDACVKDYARCSFVVPRGYVLFMDEEKLFAERLPSREGEGGVLENTHVSNKADHVDVHHTPPTPSQEGSYPTTYEEISYEEIVSTLEEQMGGRPEHGSRNNFIFSMACYLRYITNDDAAWIARILPTYGEAKEKWMGTIRSACNRHQTKVMPRIVRRTLDICKKRKAEEESEFINQKSEMENPPPMPKKLPPLIRLLVSRTPKIYQPAVANAVFPALGAHLWKTTFRYIDNTLHEATLANVLMAPTGVGKSCICQPIDFILADIRERDKKNMERERKWKQETQTKGANKDKKVRPEGLVVQEIDADVTPAAFVQRMSEADGRFLYTRMNEIELFNNLSPRGNSKGHFQLMCLAFDYNNVYGQTRVGTSSVSERVCVRLNYNISTTVRKGQSYFRSVLTDGPISRINFCTIPEQPIGSDMPVYGTYGDGFGEELRPYILRLTEARGLVECKQVSDLARQLMNENADFARLSQNRVFENLSFRANVIAFLKAMVLYVAHGERWDKSMEDFVRWSLKYDLWCTMRFFGAAIEEMENSDIAYSRPGPQNLLDLLPEVFTREQAGTMRQNQGIRQGSLKAMLSNWKKRGYIELYGEEVPQKEIARQRYIKTEEYMKRFVPGGNQVVG